MEEGTQIIVSLLGLPQSSQWGSAVLRGDLSARLVIRNYSQTHQAPAVHHLPYASPTRLIGSDSYHAHSTEEETEAQTG